MSIPLLLKALLFLNAPRCFLQLVVLVAAKFGDTTSDLDLVEYFAGMKAVTREAAARGRAAVGFEIKDRFQTNCPLGKPSFGGHEGGRRQKVQGGEGQHELKCSQTLDRPEINIKPFLHTLILCSKDQPEMMNFMGEQGYCFAIFLGLKLRCASQSMLAPVCSSWVWMNRSTSGRSLSNIMGNLARDYVRSANQQVSRAILVCLLLTAKGTFWILEQPKGSLMEHHGRFQWLARRLGLFRVGFSMAKFGGETRKDTWCYSPFEFVLKLPEYFTKPDWKASNATSSNCTIITEKADGTLSVSGGPGLKESQHYPPGFGKAITQIYFDHEHLVKAAFKDFKACIEICAVGGDRGKIRVHKRGMVVVGSSSQYW